jgi:transketolase
MEVRACLRWLVAHPQPSYLRLGKAGEPNVHSQVPAVEPGHWLVVREGREMLLSTGAALAAALDRADSSHAGYGVSTLPLWGMGSKTAQAAQVARVEQVVTMEDHLADGGFGSWLYEAIAGSPDATVKLRSIALSAEVCDTVGGQVMLHELGGLTVPR